MFKDQIYLRGAYDLLSKRSKIDFRILYGGKMSLKDMRRLEKEKSILTGKIYKIIYNCLIL